MNEKVMPLEGASIGGDRNSAGPGGRDPGMRKSNEEAERQKAKRVKASWGFSFIVCGQQDH